MERYLSGLVLQRWHWLQLSLRWRRGSERWQRQNHAPWLSKGHNTQARVQRQLIVLYYQYVCSQHSSSVEELRACTMSGRLLSSIPKSCMVKRHLEWARSGPADKQWRQPKSLYMDHPTVSHVKARHPTQDHQINIPALLRLSLHQWNTRKMTQKLDQNQKKHLKLTRVLVILNVYKKQRSSYFYSSDSK